AGRPDARRPRGLPARRPAGVVGLRAGPAEPAVERAGGRRGGRWRLQRDVPDRRGQPDPDAGGDGLRLPLPADPDPGRPPVRQHDAAADGRAGPVRRQRERADPVRAAAVPLALPAKQTRPVRPGAGRGGLRRAVRVADQLRLPAAQPGRLPDPAGRHVRQLQPRRRRPAGDHRRRHGRRLPGRLPAGPRPRRRRPRARRRRRARAAVPPGGHPHPAGRDRPGRHLDGAGRADDVPGADRGQRRPAAAADVAARGAAARRGPRRRAGHGPRPVRRHPRLPAHDDAERRGQPGLRPRLPVPADPEGAPV
ncbi:MAG: Iron compound ABC uptake transporter permease protein PiuC, partial [uncultured Friedmanniella sp.]